MPRTLNSITLDAPASAVEASVDDTFAFSGTPGFSGSGGVSRYDFKWQVDDGGGYVDMAASGSGLITANTNPVTNTNSSNQNSITVSCEQAGSYTIRMAGAPATGGGYTVFSATQTVDVTVPAGTDDLLANDVTGASSVSAPAIGQVHALNAADVAAGSSVSAPALGQVHGLTAVSVASASSVGEPAIAIVTPLLAEDVAASSSVSAPSIAQIHALLASGVSSASAITIPPLGQVHALLAADVASASSVSEPGLAGVGGIDELFADSVASASSVGVPSLAQIHTLTAADVASASELTSPRLNAEYSHKGRNKAKIAVSRIGIGF